MHIYACVSLSPDLTHAPLFARRQSGERRSDISEKCP